MNPIEKLTPQARACLDTAIEIAREMGHSRYTTGHLLLGFYREGTSRAFIVLDSIGIPGYDVKKLLKKISPPIGQLIDVSNPETEMEEIFDAAQKLAAQRNDDEIGEHHLLMAMMQQKDSAAYDIVKRLGYDPDLVIMESDCPPL